MARWLICGTFVAAWTIALEMPVPDTGELPGGAMIASHRYFVAKSIHVAVYAVMTVLAAGLPVTPRYRWLLILFLMGHATGTEMLQEALHEWCHRGGSLTDVGFDQIGIVIGVLVSWKGWTRDG